jgi:hypothetical protein
MSILIIPLTAILMPLILVPTTMFMKQRHQRRQWEHLERLKAMEIQLPMPKVHAVPGHGSVAAIGAGVPIASVLTAFLTSIIFSPEGGDEIAVPAIAWGCAFLISTLALGTSLILAFMHRSATKENSAVEPLGNGKPQFDPDAFDVVSSRG